LIAVCLSRNVSGRLGAEMLAAFPLYAVRFRERRFESSRPHSSSSLASVGRPAAVDTRLQAA
jgi:hypothetical protein